MIKPQKLVNGDLIGVCAPSGVIKEKHKESLLETEKLLNNYSLKVVYSDNLFSNSLGYSATIEEKATDFNKLVKNKNVKAIIFAKGGSNCNSILDRINYEELRKNPKFIIGFSDNTVLLNAINKKAELITYHFTNYKGFCEENIKYNTQQFENVMINGNEGEVQQSSEWITIRRGKTRGKLVGGNLSSIVKILNTQYCPDFKNKILILEDLSTESDVEMISSYLYQLKQSNVFNNISGLLLGNYDAKDQITLEKIVMDIVGDFEFPIIKCNDFGHTANNMILPIGLECTLDANERKLIYDEKSAS